MSGVRESWRDEAAETLRCVAFALNGMADALDNDDDLLGAISGMGLTNHLPALPKHIRDTLAELLTDESARGLRSDELYMLAMGGEGDK